MSLNRYAAKRDASEPSIKETLEKHGWSVQPLSIKGGPDLLCGAYGTVTELVECKTGKRKLKPGQSTWHRTWRGLPVRVLRTAADAEQLARDVFLASQGAK